MNPKSRPKAGEKERREVGLQAIEFRQDGEDDKLLFTGHAAVFDEWAEIYSFRSEKLLERIKRGAFRKVLGSDPDVRFLGLNHNPDTVMARTTNGTMTLKEETKGLRVEAELAPTTGAQDLAVLLERGDISQMSFGFRVGKDEWVEENDEEAGLTIVRRTIIEFSELFDVSPVTFPAYEGTDAGLRAVLCGVEVRDSAGEIRRDALLDLVLQVHRGDQEASEEERAALDGLLAKTDLVSPWTAERAARAYSQEPELRAALQASGVTMAVEDPPSGKPDHRLAAWKRRLDLLERAA